MKIETLLALKGSLRKDYTEENQLKQIDMLRRIHFDSNITFSWNY